MPRLLPFAIASWALVSALGCAIASGGRRDTGQEIDVGVDARVAVDLGGPNDAGSTPDMARAIDMSIADMGIDTASAPDTGPLDAGLSPCETSGGTCVHVMPGVCAAPSGMLTSTSCGGTAMVSCCVMTARDAGTDAATVNACVAQGGHCVALSPGTCPAPNVTGGPSCGTGLGVTCCTPPAGTDAGSSCSTAPRCMFVGTAQEGWYAADGTVICLESTTCAGITPVCQRVGTSSQGWYTSGHGCSPRVNEVLNDAMCCP